jgi:hypothetical protein
MGEAGVTGGQDPAETCELVVNNLRPMENVSSREILLYICCCACSYSSTSNLVFDAANGKSDFTTIPTCIATPAIWPPLAKDELASWVVCLNPVTVMFVPKYPEILSHFFPFLLHPLDLMTASNC